MALIAEVTRFGITLETAYHKIARLNYESIDHKSTDENGSSWVKHVFCTFEVLTYSSEAARQAYAEPMYRELHTFVPTVAETAEDIITQAYAHLKSLDGYQNAVDC